MSGPIDWSAMLQDIITLFIVIDPITLGIYVGASTADSPPEIRSSIVRRGVCGGCIILLFFAVVGDYVLGYFGIESFDFMIALGIILMIVAILDFMDLHLPKELKRDKPSLVPIATPLIAGPAAISTIIFIKYSHGVVYAIISIIINTILTYVSLKGGTKLAELLGKSGSQLIDKIIALILAGLAISLIRRGILNIIP